MDSKQKYNLDYESAVISILLTESDQTDEYVITAKAALTTECFYNTKNQIVFNAIAELSNKNKEIGIIQLEDYFKNNSEKRKRGSVEVLAYDLTQLAEAPYASKSQFDSYVKEVFDYYLKRKAHELMITQSEKGVEGIDNTIKELIEGREKLAKIGKTLPTIADFLDEGLFENLIEKPKDYIKTFSDTFNYNLNGGLHRKRFFCLTAAAGGGKTAFAMQLLDEIAKNKIPCLYVGLEMSKEELLIRSLSRIAKVNSGNIEKHSYLDKAYENKHKLLGKLKEANSEYYNTVAPYLTIWEAQGRTTITMIANEIKKIQHAYKNKYDLEEIPPIVVVVDPLNGLSTGNEQIDSNPIEKAGTIGGDLKRLARDLDIPVIGISDTTKEGQRKADKGQSIGAGGLRYSYEITHRADIIGEIRIGKKLIDEVTEKMNTVERHEFMAKSNLPNDSYVTYAMLELSKQRSGAKIPALFVYHMDQHLFKPIDLRLKENEAPF